MLRNICFGLLLLLTVVFGHGRVTNPEAEFNPPLTTTFARKISANSTFSEGKFNGTATENSNEFAKAFKAQTKFKSLRDMLEFNTTSPCGYSLINAAKKPIPADSTMTWQNPPAGVGFVDSHTGPCEVWLDDQQVFQDDNCAGHYKAIPEAHLPIDYSPCTKKGCILRFFNLAVHEPMWQVYSTYLTYVGL
ncbi:hypothetical protein THRCLA_02137 [Thraustotheca clavata]|uniref:Secreted protein n=1 Tax=Thraustotheca clavata TaxID=74557 RepID=A0A1W0A669_9STRA|nr:hypothetical protein THRCLA_02137 [Thraustotheca clavata]